MAIVLDGLKYPTTDGTNGQVLSTDGSGNITFVNQTGGSGGGGAAITIQEEGSSLSTAAETINFVGAGVTATGTDTTKTITIPAVGTEGGYEFTGGFANRGNAVTYTSAMAASETWYRFGFNSAKQITHDAPYWSNGSDPNEAPHSGTTDYQGVGAFSGAYMPTGVTKMFDFTEDGSYQQATSLSGLTVNNGVVGSYDFNQHVVGDFANIRVDFYATPSVSNTTLECALIWSTRDASNNITFTFPLTITPIHFGDNTAGKTYLNRPVFTAYFASHEDVNARALFAVKADAQIDIQPYTTLTTIVGR